MRLWPGRWFPCRAWANPLADVGAQVAELPPLGWQTGGRMRSAVVAACLAPGKGLQGWMKSPGAGALVSGGGFEDGVLGS